MKSLIDRAQSPLAITLLLIFMIGVLVGWPLLIIFALNTLFPALAINYGFWQWLSVVIINITCFGDRVNRD